MPLPNLDAMVHRWIDACRMRPGRPLSHQIELRFAVLSEPSNSMDPNPFHHRDLDRGAVEFPESWALAFPPGQPLSNHRPRRGDATGRPRARPARTARKDGPPKDPHE